MEIELITAYFLGLVPTIMNIVTTSGFVTIFRKYMKRLSKNEKLDKIIEQMNIILNENYELKKLNKELLTKIDHVERS